MKKYFICLLVLLFVLEVFAADSCTTQTIDIYNAPKGKKLETFATWLSSPDGQGLIGTFMGGTYKDQYGNWVNDGQVLKDKALEECYKKNLSPEEYNAYKQNKLYQENLRQQQLYQQQQLQQLRNINNNLQNINNTIQY